MLHGGSGSLTLTMPDPDPVQQQGLSSGPEQNQTLPQPSQLPLPARFDAWSERTKSGRMLDSVEPTFRSL